MGIGLNRCWPVNNVILWMFKETFGVVGLRSSLCSEASPSFLPSFLCLSFFSPFFFLMCSRAHEKPVGFRHCACIALKKESLGVSWWCSRSRTQHHHCCGFGLLLWCRLHPWPGNFHLPWVRPKKKKKSLSGVRAEV